MWLGNSGIDFVGTLAATAAQPQKSHIITATQVVAGDGGGDRRFLVDFYFRKR